MTVARGVAAGHPVSARAGLDMLARGGNAADAAVAMMLTGCAAESIFTGLAGGGFATYYDAATRKTTCVDFFVTVPGLDGRRPGTGTPIEVIFVGQPMPYEIGPPTVAVPGLPAGARHIWQRWARLPWADVVAPALEASHGSPFPAAHAELLPQISQAMLVGEGVSVYSRDDGSLVQAGDYVVHHDHHRAFELLLEDPNAFYEGEFAKAMLQALGDESAMSAEDLQAYEVIETTSRRAGFGHHTVAARGNDLDDVLGTMSRAAPILGGDPLTHPDTALALVDALRGSERRGDTTNIVAVDAEGNACVATTTLGLGSGVWVPGFGTHLNSMLGEGELIRGEPNPGTRMGSMMSPLVVLDDHDQLMALAGAAGGSRIRSALVQVTLRMMAGASPQEAIDAPRLNALPGAVRLEPGFSEAVIAALREAGNEVYVADGRAAYFGGVSAISELGGGADPRRGGVVIMLEDAPR